MRSMFLLTLLIVLATSGTVFALQAPTMQGGLPDRWYQEVQYESNATEGYTTAEHGNVLQWDTTAHDGYKVTKCNTADAENVAGIVPVDDDTAHNLDGLGRPLKDGDVFLMQIWGYVKDLPSDGNITAGGAIGSEATMGNSTGDGDGMGVGLEADGADTSSPSGYSGDVFLRIIGDVD
jgi:hypothetical protein